MVACILIAKKPKISRNLDLVLFSINPVSLIPIITSKSNITYSNTNHIIVLLSLVIVYLVLINIFSSMVDLISLLTYEYNDTINLAISMPGNDLPMPGVRCPTCAANGQEV